MWNLTYKETIRLRAPSVLVVPGRSVYACAVVRYIFQVFGLRVLISFVPSVFLPRGVFQSVTPSPWGPPLPVVFSSLVFFCFSLTSQVPVFCFLFCGSPWLGCAIVQAMGVSFNLWASCQKWKPLDLRGTQLPSCDAVVNLYLIFLLACFCSVISS